MRILVVGSGGREHALVRKLRQSARVSEVFCAPGNAGIEQEARCLPVASTDQRQLLALILSERIDCVVVGPETPLAEGLVDYLQAQGIAVLGPRRNAAKLESSKVFAKEFMARHGISTAPFVVHRKSEEALAYVESREARYPTVIKADGLAAGKGVIIARDRAEARAAIKRIMIDEEFGPSGRLIVMEEFLEGAEASYIVFTDGETVVPAVAARDHKALYDHDRGPNTGGMGAYSSNTILGPELEQRILTDIVRPVIAGMQAEGSPFQGILYSGLMLTADGPQVLEFNVRMGDPEAQVILPRLDSDLATLCEQLCQRWLKSYTASWSQEAAVCVVLVSDGYPGLYEKGKIITGLDAAQEDRRIAIYHSGTRRQGEHYVTDGGRVLGVTATAADVGTAAQAAYEAAGKIKFEGMHYRRDIGFKIPNPDKPEPK